LPTASDPTPKAIIDGTAKAYDDALAAGMSDPIDTIPNEQHGRGVLRAAMPASWHLL
jgi:hypothetical protein